MSKKICIFVLQPVDNMKDKDKQLTETLQFLEAEGYNCHYEDKYGQPFYGEGHSDNLAEPDDITHFYVYWLESNVQKVCRKTIKVPKTKAFTPQYAMQKLKTESIYKNFSDKFEKIINVDSIDVYPTSYGIGVFVLFGNPKKTKQKIDKKLNELGINYTNEYSDAAWVFRYKISKSKENITKLDLINS